MAHYQEILHGIKSMPHLRLEYSENITIGQNELQELFLNLHEVLVDKAGAELFSCQSRALCCENFCIGDGNKTQAFVNLQVFLLEGRASDQLHQTGHELLKTLQSKLKAFLFGFKAQFSVHLNEMPQSHYYKIEL